MDLHSRGLTDKEIAEVMNGRGISTPTGLAYYPQLVSVTRRKIGLRKLRRESREVQVGVPSLFVDKTY
jgi:hypothetical protein